MKRKSEHCERDWAMRWPMRAEALKQLQNTSPRSKVRLQRTHWSFAVAQPVFDILSRNPEFFAVRGSEPADLLILTLVLCVLPALPFICAEALAGLLGPRIRSAVEPVSTALLAAAIVLPLLKCLEPLPGQIMIPTAGAIGVAFSVAYCRLLTLGRYLTFLSLAVLIFLVTLVQLRLLGAHRQED